MPMDYEKRDTGRIPESVGTPLDMLFVQTIAGPDATAYPAEEDAPTVYYCKILGNVTYPKTVGAQTLTSVDTDRRDYVFNLCSGSYIEEDSIVAAFRKNNRLWTMDKVRQVPMLVLGHSLGTTAHSSGSLSRLNPRTGAVIWTADLGTTGGVPKIAYGVDLDSRGNVYAVWRQSADGSGLLQAANSSGQTQGVVKFDKDGNTLATYALPNTNLSFAGPSYVGPHPTVRVDPNDDDAVYVGCDYDINSKWLYKFDSSLTVVWSIGTAATGFAETSRCSSIALDAAGNLYVGNASIWSVTSGGTVGSNDVTTPFEAGLFVDPLNDKLRLASVESVSSAYAATGWTTFPTSAFSRQRTDFTTPEALGTWDSSRSYDFAGSSGYGDGLRTIFTSANSMRYARAGGLGNYHACYLITDPSGVAGTSGTWGDPSTAAVIYSLSRDAASGNVYVAGAGTDSSARRIVAQIDPATGGTTWTAQVYLLPLASSSGWAVAARTIRP